MDKSIATLVTAFGADTFHTMPLADPVQHSSDRLAYLASAVDLAAQRFQVTLPTMDLRFTPATSMNGASGMADYQGGFLHIRLTGEGVSLPTSATEDGGWRIHIEEAFRDNDLAVTLIAAHELAHFVLRRDGLDSDDEQLVDVAVILLGYGPLLHTFRTTSQQYRTPSGRVAWTSCGPSYMHPAAIEYVDARRRTLGAS